MKQTRQALEFVTITKPDEIKDPIKQRAIRRQARRRENGTKDSSRKPFQIIIDLPGGDTYNAAEQSILGRQKASPYYLPPADYSHLERNAVVPSFDLLPSISTSRGLLFTSYFPPEINTRAGQLVNFSKKTF
jgi:hypothetical protein